MANTVNLLHALLSTYTYSIFLRTVKVISLEVCFICLYPIIASKDNLHRMQSPLKNICDTPYSYMNNNLSDISP